jgi:uncharacterized protein YjbI with pentapeptide repeats
MMDDLPFEHLLNRIAVRKERVLYLGPYPGVQLEHLDLYQFLEVVAAIRFNFKTVRMTRFSDAEFHGVIRDMCKDLQTTLDLHECHGGEVLKFDDAQLGILMTALPRNQRLQSVGDLFTYITEGLTEKQSIDLAHTLQQLPHLQEIDTTGFIVSSQRKMKVVSSMLTDCTSLRNLTITRSGSYTNALHDSGAHSIALYIADNTVLVSLSLTNNNLHPGGIACISRALLSNSTLTTLNLDDNALSNWDPIDFLNVSTQLRTLSLSGTAVKLVDHAHILPMMSQLTSLDLSKLSLDSEFLDAILTGGHLVQLTRLNLHATGLQPMHMPLLQEYIMYNTSLTDLDVGCNINIVGHAATAWANLLKTNSKLKSLSLDHINMGVTGLIVFSRAILVNTTLTDLSFGRLAIMTTASRHAAVRALVSLIEVHPTLRRLDVSGCRLDAHHLVQLGLAIKRAMRWKPLSLIIRGHETSTCRNTSTLVDPAVQEQIGITVQSSFQGSVCEQEYIVDAFHRRIQDLALAFVMGSHPRIGNETVYKDIAPDIVTKIAQLFFPR